MNFWNNQNLDCVKNLAKLRKRAEVLTSVSYRTREADWEESYPEFEYRHLYWDLVELIVHDGTNNNFKRIAIRLARNIEFWRYRAIIDKLGPSSPRLIFLNYTPIRQIYRDIEENGPNWTA